MKAELKKKRALFDSFRKQCIKDKNKARVFFIENNSSHTAIPDVSGVVDGMAFWIETKDADDKTGTYSFEKGQEAELMLLNWAGVASYFLVFRGTTDYELYTVANETKHVLSLSGKCKDFKGDFIALLKAYYNR